MRRRDFIAGLGGTAAALPFAARAQQSERPRLVGLLTPSDPVGRHRALLQGLEKLGYREGQNIALEVRSADGKLERLPSLATELVHTGAEVIVTLQTPGTQAAIDAKTKIPIVMALVGDPVGSGFVPNLNRPGGSVTGVSNAAGHIAGKRLAILKQALPAARRIAVFTHPDDPIRIPQLREVEEASAPLVSRQKYFRSSNRATISNARLPPPWNGKPTRCFVSSPKPAYRSPNFRRNCCSGIACQECSPPGSMSKTAA